MSALTIGLIAYIILQMGIAYWASRKIAGDSDYLVAGRRLGVFTLGVSLFATWFGGETVMGASAAIANEGLAGARAEPVGYALCLVASALFVAGAMRAKGYMTLADFFRERFGKRAEVTAALVAIPTSIIWAAAQLIALSALLSAVTDLAVTATLLGAGTLVIAYTLMGGLLGDVVTDLVQTIVVLAGLLIMMVLLLQRTDGLANGLALIDPAQYVLVPPGESWIERIDAFAIPILGSIVAQEMIARFLGARTAKTAVRGGLLAGGLYLLFGAFPLVFGLIGAGAGFDPAAGDLYLPLMAAELMPSALFVVFVGALFSAVLSTVDSALLAVSGLASENLYGRLRPNANPQEKLIAARALTVVAGLAALIVAFSGDSIYGLVELASSLGSAGLFVSLLIGLHFRFGGEWSALAALAAGLVTIWLADFVLVIPGGFLLSITMAAIAYLGVGFLAPGTAAASAE